MRNIRAIGKSEIKVRFLFLVGMMALLALAGCGARSTPEPVVAAASPTPEPPVPLPTHTPTAVPPTPLPTRTPTQAPSALVPTHTPTSVPPATDAPAPPPAVEGQGNADVLYVRAVQASDESWTFSVTVQHPDTGWEDYADGWDVVTPDGTVIKPDADSPFTRLLLHPHEQEQPFTRSQSGIWLPEGVTQVRVRAHDLVDGFGGREVVVDLSTLSGPDFEIERRP